MKPGELEQLQSLQRELEEIKESPQAKLLSIEQKIDSIARMIGPDSPGRVECPDCGGFCRLGGTILTTRTSTYVQCKGCDIIIKILGFLMY